jgi:hypothetical protein
MMMKSKTALKTRRPWRNGLIATTGLSLFTVIASLLWRSGLPEWAFLLIFVAIWLLISVIWSNDDFNEESSTILARIVDENFSQMHERLEQLEKELEQVRSGLEVNGRKAA